MLSFAQALKRALYVITSSLSAPALMRALYEISSCSRLFRCISTNQLHGLRCNVVFCTCIEESAECDYIWLQALMPNVKLCRPLGRAPFTKLWLKSRHGQRSYGTAKGHSLQAFWQRHFLPFRMKLKPKARICRPLSRATFFKFWFKLEPAVKLCRPLGKATFSKFW